jgi:hypothetical protein
LCKAKKRLCCVCKLAMITIVCVLLLSMRRIVRRLCLTRVTLTKKMDCCVDLLTTTKHQ